MEDIVNSTQAVMSKSPAQVRGILVPTYRFLFLMCLFTAAADSSGILTHTEVAHRALLSYDSTQFGAGTVRSVLVRRQAAFQAGAAFPDSFYNPLCGEQYHDVSEDMHWEEGALIGRL